MTEPGSQTLPSNSTHAGFDRAHLDTTLDAVIRWHDEGFGGIACTPCLHSEPLSQLTGTQIHVKLENLQQTGSFKERGAYARMRALGEDVKARGVVAASAGNHAQGVALHGRRLGAQTRIFMPLGTPTIKVNQTRGLGADVVLEGEDFDAAKQAALAFAEQSGAVFVHPFDDPHVLCGQGMIAREMLSVVPDLDTLVIPVGGGGLASGMGLMARRINPDIRLIGVQADLFPSFHNLYHQREAPVGGVTLAEGIAVREPGTLTRSLLVDLLDEMLVVDEAMIERALNLFLTQMRVLAEGAGAVGLAAVLAHPDLFRGGKTGLVLCGGNIDTRLLSSLLLRDLARSNRLARLRIQLIDVPGQLSGVSRVISEAGGNVTDVAYHKTFSNLPAKVTNIDISLEAQDADHMAAIITALRTAGFTVERADY